MGAGPLDVTDGPSCCTSDSFGNVLLHKVGSVGATPVQTGTFTYDDQNRITGGHGQSFGWQPNGNFQSFAGTPYGYDSQHVHAADTVGGADRYDYNLNGSMSVANKGTADQQALKWDSRNQLQQVTWGSPPQSELYGYDESGSRFVRALVSGGTTNVTYYPFPHFEHKGSSSGVTKYYFFGGERFALRTGTGAGNNNLRLLYKDRISSTVHVSDGNVFDNLKARQRAGKGSAKSASLELFR